MKPGSKIGEKIESVKVDQKEESFPKGDAESPLWLHQTPAQGQILLSCHAAAHRVPAVPDESSFWSRGGTPLSVDPATPAGEREVAGCDCRPPAIGHPPTQCWPPPSSLQRLHPGHSKAQHRIGHGLGSDIPKLNRLQLQQSQEVHARDTSTP